MLYKHTVIRIFGRCGTTGSCKTFTLNDTSFTGGKQNSSQTEEESWPRLTVKAYKNEDTEIYFVLFFEYRDEPKFGKSRSR